MINGLVSYVIRSPMQIFRSKNWIVAAWPPRWNTEQCEMQVKFSVCLILRSSSSSRRNKATNDVMIDPSWHITTISWVHFEDCRAELVGKKKGADTAMM